MLRNETNWKISWSGKGNLSVEHRVSADANGNIHFRNLAVNIRWVYLLVACASVLSPPIFICSRQVRDFHLSSVLGFDRIFMFGCH